MINIVFRNINNKNFYLKETIDNDQHISFNIKFPELSGVSYISKMFKEFFDINIYDYPAHYLKIDDTIELIIPDEEVAKFRDQKIKKILN